MGPKAGEIEKVDTGNIYHKYALNAEALAALNRKATADLLAEGLGPAEVADGTVGEVVELSDHVKKLRHAHLNKFGRSLKSPMLITVVTVFVVPVVRGLD